MNRRSFLVGWVGRAVAAVVAATAFGIEACHQVIAGVWELTIDGRPRRDIPALSRHIVRTHKLQAAEIRGMDSATLVEVHSALHEDRYLAWWASRRRQRRE